MRLTRPSIINLALGTVFLFCLSAAAQELNVPPRVMEAVDVENLLTLSGNTHPLALPEFDHGAAPDSLPMRRMLLVLQRSPVQEEALRHLLDEQQTNGSPNFHKWLTPEEYGRRFGPADADIQAVAGWLTAEGFEVSKVAAGRTVIEFTGSAGLVRQAFHTEIHKFVLNDEEHWANASDPQIPAALAPVVRGLASLNSFPRKPLLRELGAFQRSKATGEVKPLFTFSLYGLSYYGIGPSDFATIYNILPLWNAGMDGTGQSIAIVSPSNINPQDVTDFRSLFGLPPNPPKIILDGPDPGIIPGYETEADLDVEWAGAVAKKATIDLVVSQGTESSAGVDLAALYIIDNNLAPVMSVSYGLCEAYLGDSGNAFYNALWKQAAAQGITVLVSSGDSGSAGCDPYPYYQIVAQHGLAVSGLASTPFNVAVGGTEFNDVGSQSTYWNSTNNSTTGLSAKSYIPEVPWNSTCARAGSLTGCASLNGSGLDLLAGGGGASSLYSKPAWQTGLGVPQDNHRDIPDVSLFAGLGVVTSDGQVAAGSMSFYIICARDRNGEQGGSPYSCDLNAPYLNFIGVGGTSASSPAFAGVMALVNQKTNDRQGNANYVLYKQAAQSGASCTSNASAVSKTSCIFYDVASSNNSVACQSGSPNCSNQSGGSGVLVEPTSSTTPAWHAAAGFDLATGLGSVNAANLVNKWTSVSFTPSTTTLSLSTTPPTSPITLTHGQPVNVSVQVAPESGTGTPTGDVSLIAEVSNSGGNSSTTAVGGPFTLSGGAASGTTSLLPGGTYNATAHYAGDGTFGASDSSPVAVTVSPETSQTKVGLVTFDPTTWQVTSYAATTSPYGSPYLLRVDVTNSSGTECSTSPTPIPCPSGQVTVTDNGNTLGAGAYQLNSQGYTEDQDLITNQFPGGTHNVVASYGGDRSYNANTSGTVPLTIIPATTTLWFGGVGYVIVGQDLSFLAGLTTQSDGVAPTGTVTLLNGSTPIGSAPVTGNAGTLNCSPCATGEARISTTFSAVGTASIMAEYSGDTNYASSTSPSQTFTITDFSVAANPNALTVTAGQSGTSTITISSINGFANTVALSCSGLPTGTTCTFSPSSPWVGSNSTATSTLTLSTTANAPPRVPERRVPPPLAWHFGWTWLPGVLITLAVLMGLIPVVAGRHAALRGEPPGPGLASARLPQSATERSWRAAALLWALAATLLIAGNWAACGGGGGGGGGPVLTPGASLSTSSITFGSQDVRTTGAPQSVTLSSTGTGPLSITGISLFGVNAGDFAQTNNCGTSVAAGSNCTINVTFAPTAVGTRTAYVTILDNAAGSPRAVTLSGTGTQPTPKGTSTFTVSAETWGVYRTAPVTLTVQ